MERQRRVWRFLAYCLPPMGVAGLSYFVVFKRILGEHAVSGVESVLGSLFLWPGMLLIWRFFPGLHAGWGVYPGLVVCNTVAYLAMAFFIPRALRRLRSGFFSAREFAGFSCMFAVWTVLALFRGRGCVYISESWLPAAAEGLLIAATSWSAGAGAGVRIAAYCERDASLRDNRVMLLALGVALGVVLAYGLAAVVFCRWRI